MNAHQDAQDANLTPAPAGVASVPTVDAAAVLASHKPRAATRARDNSTRWLCDECGQAWNVDGCEAVLLAKRVIELEGAAIHRRVSTLHGYITSCALCMVAAAATDHHPDPAEIAHRDWCPLRATRAGEGGGG